MSDRKRPFDAAGAEASSSKKMKSDTPPSHGPGASNGTSSEDLIAKKRAEFAAKLAAMKSKNPALAGIGAPTMPSSARPLAAPVPRVPVVPASLPSKVVYAGTPSPSLSHPSSGQGHGKLAGNGSSSGSTSIPGLGSAEDLLRKVAEAKKKVVDAKLATNDNPYLAVAAAKKKPSPVEAPQQGAGLNMAAHPLLLETTTVYTQSKKDRYKPMQPKFASIKANARNQPTPTPTPIAHTPTPLAVQNPYTSLPSTSKDPKDPSSSATAGLDFEGAPRTRAGRKFHFAPKGKYIQLANQMRQENQLEELKQRIAENARKAGIDGSLDIERGIKRAPPPAAEWWDEALLPSKKYDDIDTLGLERLNIRNPSSPITIYIQHPIPIPAPNEKNAVALKPLMLTKKEQKKMRKLRRKQDLQDRRDRIRMGLLPPDPPKGKHIPFHPTHLRLSNLMKVLTSDAIQDPTRVEARVRREVAMRKHTHEKANAARKLAPEERAAKLQAKKEEEDKKGIYAAVFRIGTLEDARMRFKVRKNAEQMGLTGVCVFGGYGTGGNSSAAGQGEPAGAPGSSSFCLVYVEGGRKYVKSYKRLMMVRIAWTEAARPRGGEDVEIEDADAEGDVDSGEDSEDEGDDEGKESKQKKTPASTAAATKADPNDRLANNRCHLVWEGLVREREFNSFKGKHCPTDREAREVLGERLKGYWDVAKNWKAEEEELF